jgi:16S rRNA (cytidine1402-2'-O)-methyltransferase
LPRAPSVPSEPPQASDSAARSKLAPGLHLVATPIGNLGDLSPRALATLKSADMLLCEDTRITGKLLRLNSIERSKHPYHEHNAAKMRPGILAALEKGASIALASDAGTPLVSDPGYKLVREVIDAGFDVYAVPGPSAVLAALVTSGLPSDRFMMAGFLPAKQAARRRMIDEFAGVPGTLIWFEAANRLPATLADLHDVLGPRPAAVARELTKKFEEVRRGGLDALAAHYAEAGPPRGEVVIVVGQASEDPAAAWTEETIDDALLEALATRAPSAAAAHVAALCGRPRRDLYLRALELKPGLRVPGPR